MLGREDHALTAIAFSGIPLKNTHTLTQAELEPGYRIDVLVKASLSPGVYCLYNAVVDAQTALMWGLVNRVAAAGELEQLSLELAAELAGNAPLAQRGNKRVIREVLNAHVALDPEVERSLIELRRACFSSEDFREGVRAFAEKRAPRWQGR